MAAGLTPVADGDIYWHLAAGREIVRRYAPLHSDPFSISAAGRPWVDVHWLFQLMVYALHELGGLRALVIAKCLALGYGALVLYGAVARRARALFVIGCVACLVVARHLLLVRPVIVSLVLMAWFFVSLERFRKSGRGAALVALPGLQVLWSNCQGLSALGPAMIAAYALAAVFEAWTDRADPVLWRHARMLGVVCLCACAASVITPYGFAGLGLSAALFERLLPGGDHLYVNVAENVPPLSLEAAGQFWHLPWFLAWLALSFAVCRRVVLSHVLLIVGFGALALLSNRNLLLFYWIAAPIAAQQLAPAGVRALFVWRRERAPAIARMASYICLMALLTLAATAAARESALAEPVPFRFPTASVPVLAAQASEGRVFCADQQGGYLIWRLYPRFKPYLDTRLVLRTPEQFREYLGLAAEPARFDAFAQRHALSHVVLPVAYPDRYLNLIAYLYRNPAWQLIFSDGAEVLFARRSAGLQGWSLADPTITDRILASLSERYRGAPRLHDAALFQFATLDVALSEYAQADRVLARGQSPALGLRARTALAAGDLDSAQALGERRARDAAGDVSNLVLMAQLYARRGQLQQALYWLRRALAHDPLDAEALSLLARMEEQHDP